jgi:hypothetical protein
VCIEDYNTPIIVSDNGISVGTRQIPGCLSSVFTIREDNTAGHWCIELTLMSAVEPIFDTPDSQIVVDATTYRLRPKDDHG